MNFELKLAVRNLHLLPFSSSSKEVQPNKVDDSSIIETILFLKF